MLDTLSLECPALAEPLGRIGSLAATKEGQVLVLDVSGRRVVRFEDDGQCRTIGGPGRGPGEFSFPAGLALATDGRIAVRDDAKRAISWFSVDGVYESLLELPLVEPMNQDALDITPASIIVREVATSAGKRADALQGPREHYRFYDLAGRLTATVLPAFPVGGDCARPSAYWRGLAIGFSPSVEAFVATDGRIVGGCTDSDTLWAGSTAGSADFRPLLVLSDARRPFPGDVKDAMLDADLERYSRDEPGLKRGSIDVPVRLPAWRSVAQLTANDWAVLVLDSVFLPPGGKGDDVLAAYALSIYREGSGLRERVSLPLGVRRTPTMATAGGHVFLLAEFATGETAVVRVSLPAESADAVVRD